MPTLNNSDARRLGIYCFYDRNGHAARFIDFFLRALKQYFTDLIIIVNGKIDNQSRAMFKQYADSILVRENTGLDVAAFRQAMVSVGWEKLGTYDEVICLNDTIMGPVKEDSFERMFTTMSAKDVDFWGITAYADDVTEDEQIPAHIQSYWHAYRRNLVASRVFQKYWEQMPVWESYADVTRNHEMTFTKYLADHGFTWDTYIDYKKYSGLSPYPMLYMPMQLLRDDDCPVFKRRSFFVDYSAYIQQTAGQPGLDLYDYIDQHTDYDVDLIWDAILKNFNIADIHKALHLNRVLPVGSETPRSGNSVRSAFIYHIYFIDLLDETCSYISNIPDETDVYVTTTPDKINKIQNKMDSLGLRRTVNFIPVENRGRDVSALLVAARDVVLSGKYDVVGFAHDKKSSQNQKNGHHGTESQGFAYKLLENTLGSKQYAENILTLFANEPRLGQVAPPPPFHALYFAHTLPLDWGANFESTKAFLKDMDIEVPVESNKPTLSAIGSCYWFRVAALRPLFERQWKYEDFPSEETMKEDGTISHAIERANGYICQSQGYYPAWVLSDRYARIELTSLVYDISVLLGSSSRVRKGESILENAYSLHQGTSRFTGLRKVYRRLLKAVQSLPKPLGSGISGILRGGVEVLRKLKRSISR
ncbi:rhamnan synthesis F family protein [Bifidobacterium tsurumiense]|uniref:Lipopolysaccharide biosynthesis protein n=1 Tax=Bifidobacterium tsurumiense TaxID=356829 RepID=A0A087EI26_9BIFI|nr:rhamnan synthesis F family protein [Bifidobacterium tsurumiense]KFJ07427.1 Lipopolysaccharide biosynthesis protein [Bifidobacterium tsurumiense]